MSALEHDDTHITAHQMTVLQQSDQQQAQNERNSCKLHKQQRTLPPFLPICIPAEYLRDRDTGE